MGTDTGPGIQQRGEAGGGEEVIEIDSMSEGLPLKREVVVFDNLTWLSTKDAAVYLRKFKRDGKPSDGAIRSAIGRGLRARKWGRRLYIRKDELDRLLELSMV